MRPAECSVYHSACQVTVSSLYVIFSCVYILFPVCLSVCAGVCFGLPDHAIPHTSFGLQGLSTLLDSLWTRTRIGGW